MPEQGGDCEAQPDAFLAWKDIAPNAEGWHRKAVKYLSEIWPEISSREARNDTWWFVALSASFSISTDFDDRFFLDPDQEFFTKFDRGDEVECQIVSFDHEARKATLSLKQKGTLEKLPENGIFHPEFAKYMIETTPLKPFTSSIKSLLEVEEDLRGRRRKINESLSSHERLLTLSVFPMLGTEPLTDPDVPEQPNLNIDGVISDGPYSLAKDNIQARSNHEPDIRVPIFRDTHTKLPEHLHLNHILFGPGGCGLQATFQCKNLRDARVLHDQLVVLGPIFLALTAATPIYQGVLVDTDVRWNQTASAVDDRAEDELSQVAERWSTAPMFLRESEDVANVEDKLHPTMKKRVEDDTDFLQAQGMDPVMASYFAHLHLRDPLYLSAKAGKHEEVTPEAVHKSICASVWSHVRLKLPEPGEAAMGWRVEFRPMEVQLADFANAAILVFLDLVRQVLSSDGNGAPLELWMPLDLVKENMDRAHARNAVTEQQFWFPLKERPTEMTLDQIVHGDASLGFDQGLMQLVEGLLNDITPDGGGDSKAELQPYLDLVSRRVRGEEPTPAQWMRSFIAEHSDYKKNSVMPDSTCYDMLTAVAKME